MGVFTGRSVGGWIKRRHLRTAVKKLEETAERFRDTFLELYDRVIGSADAFYDSRLQYISGRLAEVPVWKRWFVPSIETVFYKMATDNLHNEQSATRNYYRELHQKISEAKPSEGGMILFAQGPEVLNGVEPLTSYRDEVSSQIDRVEKERKKIG